MEDFFKVTLKVFFKAFALCYLVGNGVRLFLDYSFALHRGSFKYNKVVTFCLTISQIRIDRERAALHVISRVHIQLHVVTTIAFLLVAKVAPLDNSVAGKNQAECTF